MVLNHGRYQAVRFLKIQLHIGTNKKARQFPAGVLSDFVEE